MYKKLLKSFLFSLVLIYINQLCEPANATVVIELDEYHNRVASTAHQTDYHDISYSRGWGHREGAKNLDYTYPRYPKLTELRITCKMCGKRGVSMTNNEFAAVDQLGKPCPKDFFKVDLAMEKDLSELWSDETRALIRPFLVRDKASKEKWDRIYDALRRKAQAIDDRKK